MKLALSGRRKRMIQPFRPKQKKTTRMHRGRCLPKPHLLLSSQCWNQYSNGKALRLVNKLQQTFRVLIRKHVNTMFWLAFPVHFHDPEILSHPSVHMGWRLGCADTMLLLPQQIQHFLSEETGIVEIHYSTGTNRTVCVAEQCTSAPPVHSSSSSIYRARLVAAAPATSSSTSVRLRSSSLYSGSHR